MKVLVIDNNAHHAELAKHRLEREGWEVETTDEPRSDEALNDYDFILLDYSMEQVSGIELLKSIKEAGVRTPVIFVTGHGNEIIASEAIKLGAYDYVVKDTKLVYLDRLPTVIRESKSKHELIETNRFLIQELRRANDRLQRLTFTDEMTGVYNYRFLSNQLSKEVQRAERYGKPLSVCLVDMDEFKQINDQYGHPSGDAALKKVSMILQETVRSVDFVGRYGGDEFVIIFPDTKIEDALAFCERMISRMSEEKIKLGNREVSLKLSIGVADFHPTERNTVEKLMEAVDQCLYRVKRSGRNKVESTLNLRPVPNKERLKTVSP